MNDDQEEVTAIIRKRRICGFTWNEGTLGSHDCNDVKAARYEALKVENERLRNSLKSARMECDYCGKLMPPEQGD